MNIKEVKELEDNQLLYEHHEIHKDFNTWKKVGKFTGSTGYSWKKEDFYNTHKLLLEMMQEKGFEHNTHDELDKLKMTEDCGCVLESEEVIRVEEGKEVTLEEVISYLKPFKTMSEAVALTGDVVDEGRTSGDITIYIPESQNTSYVRHNLTSMVPVELQSRITFTDIIPSSSYIPLYNMVYELNDPVIKVSLIDIAADVVQPGRFFRSLNPDGGRKNTAFSTSSLKKKVRRYPVCVQEKLSGMRCQIHKRDSSVKILTSKGVDISHRLPKLVKVLGKDFYPDLIIDAYVSHEDGEEESFLLERDELVEGEDKKLSVVATDILHWGGEDLHYRPFGERREKLESIPHNAFDIVVGHRANDEVEMLVRLKSISGDAIIREFGSVYHLKGTTTLWYTLKKEPEYFGTILKKLDTEEGIHAYYLGVQSHEEFDVLSDDKHKVGGRTYVFVGKAESKLDLVDGTTVRLSACKLIQYKDRIRLFGAEIVELVNELPYDLSEMVGVAEESKTLQTVANIDSREELPEDGVYKYVVQAHFRGKSMHHDLRIENGSGDLESFTIFSMDAGKIKMQPKDMREAKRLYQALSYSWPRSDDRAYIGYVESVPDVFLEQKGDMESVGDMKDLPGFLLKVDQGIVEYGAQIQDIREFFPAGSMFAGNRLMMFYLERTPLEIEGEELESQGLSAELSEKELEEKYGRLLTKEEEALEFNDKAWTRTLPGIDETTNEFRFRVKSPSAFVRGTFRAKDFGSSGMYAIFARSKSSGRMEIQSIRFRKSAGWTRSKARTWLKSHGYLEKKELSMWNTSDILALFRAIEDSMVPKDVHGFSGYSDEQMREEKGFWLTWLPIDQTPYVISAMAEIFDWIPSKGFSALPKALRKKVPEKYQYWNFVTRAKRIKVRNEYIKALKTKFTVLRKYSDRSFLVEREECSYLGVTYEKQEGNENEELSYDQFSHLQKVDKNRKEYSLIRHWWKGKKATKLTQHWDLHIGGDMYVMLNNPVKDKTKAAQRKPYGKGYNQRGSSGPEFIKPGSPGNKTKSIPAWMEMQDTGHIEVVVDDELYKQFNFYGENLKGTYTLRKESKDVNAWMFEKVEVKSLSRRLSAGESIVKANIMLSVSDFGVKNDGLFHVTGAAFSHGVWNGEYYSPEVIRDRPERMLGIPMAVGPHEKVENDGSVVDMRFAEDTIFIDTVVETESGQRDVEEGGFVGFSVEITVLIDEVRNVTKKILSYDRVNIVKYPACEVCTIDHVTRP